MVADSQAAIRPVVRLAEGTEAYPFELFQAVNTPMAAMAIA